MGLILFFITAAVSLPETSCEVSFSASEVGPFLAPLQSRLPFIVQFSDSSPFRSFLVLLPLYYPLVLNPPPCFRDRHVFGQGDFLEYSWGSSPMLLTGPLLFPGPVR